VEHALWGLAPLPYHLVNVLMQAGCAVALWRVLRRLGIPGAWLGAALWAVHPVQVESVAWVTEMKNTESGLFYLLAILFFMRGPSDRKGRDCLLSLLFAACAMAAKSSTMVLPLVLVLCVWWRDGSCTFRSWRRIGPVFLLSAASGALSVWTQSQRAGAAIPAALSLAQRLVIAGDAVWFYLGKLIWPYPLMMVYPQWRIDALAGFSFAPLLGALALTIVLWMKRKSMGRGFLFAWIYFVAALLPVLGFANLTFFDYSYVSDHFQYLAAMSPLALAAALLTTAGGRAFGADSPFLPLSGAMILLVLGFYSWERCRVYRGEETLWTDTLAKNPSCWVGYNNLGLVHAKNMRLSEAAAEYRQALALHPDFAEAHNNLGSVLLDEGDANGAAAQYGEALRVDPKFTQAADNLGRIYLDAGRMSDAMREFEGAVQINPRDAFAHFNLARALAQQNRPDAAMAEYRQSLAIQPGQIEAHNNLGNLLLRTGQVPAAIAEYNEALKIDPAQAQIHFNLGVALAQARQIAAAADQFREVLRLRPGDHNAEADLAKLQAAMPASH
jgi:tetratricopeptide (TPR) repeat protein